MDEPADLLSLDVHGDLVALLIGVDLDRRRRLFRSGVLLDDDLDFGLVPRPYLDRAVEGGQVEVGRRSRREALLLALDHFVEVRADDIDAARGRQKNSDRSGDDEGRAN